MRMVIDTNYAKDGALIEWLGANPQNIAYLSEAFLMECWRPNQDIDVYNNFSFVEKFPDQIQVMKPFWALMAETNRAIGVRRRIVDRQLTLELPSMVRKMSMANRSLEIREWMQRERQRIKNCFQLMESMVTSAGSTIERHFSGISKHELKIWKSMKGYDMPIQLQKAIVAAINEGTREGLQPISRALHPRNIWDLVHSFSFRLALANVLAEKERLKQGGHLNTSPEKYKNEVIDMYIVASSLYFDGLFTHEKLTNQISIEARTALAWFAGPSHLEITTPLLPNQLLYFCWRGNASS